MRQTNLPCELNLGYTPTVFGVGRRQSFVFYSRCKGTATWEVQDTEDWKSDESKRPNSEGFYSYRLQATWRRPVYNKEGIRFHFAPADPEDGEPATVTLEVTVEESSYAGQSAGGGGRAASTVLGPGALAVALWVVTSALGLGVILVSVWELWPPILLAFTEDMDVFKRQGFLNFTSNCLLIVLSVAWLVMVIGGAEYHRKHVGQRRSWRLFGATLVAEFAILAVAQLV
jgi:hypothetical protein